MKCLKRIIICAIIGTTASQSNVCVALALNSGDAGFGKEWVRNNEIYIGGLRRWTGPQLIGDMVNYLGVNNTYYMTDVDSNDPSFQVASWTQSSGMPVMRMRQQVSWDATFAAQIQDDLQNIPTLKGFYLRDEPLPTDFAQLGVVAANIRSVAPDKLLWLNMHPQYLSTANFDLLQSTVNTDVLQYDHYPFESNGTTLTNGMFSRLMQVRGRGLAENKPYWAYIQSYANSGLGQQTRVSSESDMRMQAYAHMTAGYTGFTYYTHNKWNGQDAGLLLADGTPDTMFYTAQAVNQEVQNLGQSLRHLTSTDVRFVAGGSVILNSEPDGVSDWSYPAGNDLHLLNVDSTGTATGEDGLIGHYTDDNGQIYFMLSNLSHAAGESSAMTSVTFTLIFDASVNELLRLNRETGFQELVILANHKLTITLPGGTGDLFKYNTGDFVGIPSPLDGDLNSDGFVGVEDLNLVLGNWNLNVPPGDLRADPTHDGFVGIEDLNLVLGNWNSGSPPSEGGAIPEPATAALLGVGILTIARRYQRR